MADPFLRQLQLRNHAIAQQRLAAAAEAQQRAAIMQRSLLEERNRAAQMDQLRYQRSVANDAAAVDQHRFANDIAWRRYKLSEQERRDRLAKDAEDKADKAFRETEARRNKPIPESERKKLLENSQIYESMMGLLKSQQPGFFGSVIEPVGRLQNWASEVLPGTDPAMSNWWRDYQKMARIPQRFAVTGATMTPREIAEWQMGDVGFTTKPDEAVGALNRRLALMHRAIGRQARSLATTYSPEQVKQALGMDIPPEIPQGARYPSLEEMTQEGARLSGVGRPPLEKLIPLGN